MVRHMSALKSAPSLLGSGLHLTHDSLNSHESAPKNGISIGSAVFAMLISVPKTEIALKYIMRGTKCPYKHDWFLKIILLKEYATILTPFIV